MTISASTPALSSITCRLGHAACSEVNPAEDSIERAVMHLARRCDGASSHDAQGFNGFHTDLGHNLASEAIGRHLGFAARLVAFNVVKTYRNTQLKQAGIELPEFYVPRQIAKEKAKPAAASSGGAPRLEVRGGEVVLRGEITRIGGQKGDWIAGDVSFSDHGQRRTVKFSGVVRAAKVGSSVEMAGTYIDDDKWGPQFKARSANVVGCVELGEAGVVPVAQRQVQDQITISGVVNRILWPPGEKGFAGLLIDSEAGSRFVAKGTIRFVTEGQSLTLTGKWVPSQKDPGKQDFLFDQAGIKAERSASGLSRWIVGLEIDGVADGTADKIIHSLVHDSGIAPDAIWDRLSKTPEIVLDVKGVPLKKLHAVVEKIRVTLTSNIEENSARSQLLSWGLTPGQATKAIDAYTAGKVVEIVKANPYLLARNKSIRGVGFKIVDTNIAPKLGITLDNPFRIQAGVEFTLEEASGRGNTYLPMAVLLEKAGQVLGGAASAEALTGAIAALSVEQIVTKDDDRIYLHRMFLAESEFARLLVSRSKDASRRLPGVKPSEMAQFESATNVTLSDEQKEAVSLCVEEPVCVLTGGAGRGKTMIIRALIFILNLRKQQSVLAAPTGRAARVMAEACKSTASTIHRLIGMKAEDGSSGTGEAFTGKDVLVLDETSMLDQPLATSTIRQLPPNVKLILVGDPNQLPSVGPGRVLNNIIDSGVIPVARLTKIFRQAAESEIIKAADQMLQGFCPQPSPYVEGVFRSGQFGFIEIDAMEINKKVCDVYAQALAAGIPMDEILVISPIKGTGTMDNPGVIGLNLAMQARFNPTGVPILRNSNLRVGDRVLQTSNDYDLDVRNGDLGIITEVVTANNTGKTKGVYVRMDYGTTVVYPFDKLSGLELGYAITVHKSQGSQARLVIQVYIPHFLLNRRELLYTGATRAKETSIGVGMEKAMRDGVRNQSREERSTWLEQRLIDVAAQMKAA